MINLWTLTNFVFLLQGNLSPEAGTSEETWQLMTILQAGAYITAILIGLATLVTFITAKRNKWFEQLKPLATVANTANLFMKEILPGILDKFEKKGLAPESTLSKWASLVSPDMVVTKSPRNLTEIGQKFLDDTGMKKIVTNNLSSFIQNLESMNLKTSLDVESKSFYLIKEIEDTDIGLPLKKYLFENPNENIETIHLVGSLYLRDEYFKVHPELLDNPEETEPKMENAS